ncbi:MAG: NnrS family protein [Gammaproteobacteria bacterium]|nr:NnrS family protein [Gammaproteobacteria bacterium]
MNTTLNIEDPDANPASRFALFALGFRPFFLLAGIAAVLLVPLWVYGYTSAGPAFTYYDPMIWHGHEMLFGYNVAVIAGFLLTAVQNWTGLPTPSGKALASLALLWLAGRVLPFFDGILAPWLIAGVDLLFLPVLAITIALPLLRSRQNQQLVFLLVLAALAGANLMVHLQPLGFESSSARLGLKLASYLAVLLVVILGGRVIPFFTNGGLNRGASRQWKAVEILAIVSLLLLGILDLAAVTPIAIAVLAGFAALMHAIRLYGWYQTAIWRVPLLWILHLSYAWLVIGLLLHALGISGQINPLLYLHAFTLGTIGGMTLGMMARVSLGHTGRELVVGWPLSAAFVLINLAAVTRVILPLFDAQRYSLWIVLAGVFWTLAFMLFVLVYARILILPRVDGRPG